MPAEKPSREQSIQHMKEIVIIYGQYERLDKKSDQLSEDDRENLNLIRLGLELIGNDINMTAMMNGVRLDKDVILEPYQKGMLLMVQWVQNPEAHAQALDKVIATNYITLETGSAALKNNLKKFSPEAQAMSKPDIPPKPDRLSKQGLAQQQEAKKKFDVNNPFDSLKREMKEKLKDMKEAINNFRHGPGK